MSKQGSNSELFAHENDALTARPQLHKYHLDSWYIFCFILWVYEPMNMRNRNILKITIVLFILFKEDLVY